MLDQLGVITRRGDDANRLLRTISRHLPGIRWLKIEKIGPSRLIPDVGASRLVCPAHVGENIQEIPNAETIYCLLFLWLVWPHFSFAADENNACKGDPDQWQQLFNGKDLTGWKHVGPGHDRWRMD